MDLSNVSLIGSLAVTIVLSIKGTKNLVQDIQLKRKQKQLNSGLW